MWVGVGGSTSVTIRNPCTCCVWDSRFLNFLSHFQLDGFFSSVEDTLINACSCNCECVTLGYRGNTRVRNIEKYVLSEFGFKFSQWIWRYAGSCLKNDPVYLLIHSFESLQPPICQPRGAQWRRGLSLRKSCPTWPALWSHSLVGFSVSQRSLLYFFFLCQFRIFNSSGMCPGKRFISAIIRKSRFVYALVLFYFIFFKIFLMIF